MKIVFFGSSDFALPSLEALHTSSENEVCCVVTQPDRPQGRGLRIGTTPVKERACALGLPVYQPECVNSPDAVKYLAGMDADIFCIIAFGQILSQELLDIPKLFSLGVHGSLLPRYRGAAPIGWAIINGEQETGVTVFKVARRVDAGEIMLKASLPIEHDDTATTLSAKCAELGAETLLQGFEVINRQVVAFHAQDETESSVAPKFKAADGHIAWEGPAGKINDLVRGIQPWPGAVTMYKGKRLKIWRASVVSSDVPAAKAGEVIALDPHDGIDIACGEEVLRVHELQLEGGKRLNVQQFIAGHEIEVGETFG